MTKERFFTKHQDDFENECDGKRQDKSLWIISLLPEVTLFEASSFNSSFDDIYENESVDSKHSTMHLSEIEIGVASDVSCSDPQVSKSGQLYNRDTIININKSNNVIFKKTLDKKDFKNLSFTQTSKNVETKKENGWQNRVESEGGAKTQFKEHFRQKFPSKQKTPKSPKFNVHSLLIKQKLALLSKEKANKARLFAYSLVSQQLATGYAFSLSKHELAKQFIFHAANWKPTKITGTGYKKPPKNNKLPNSDREIDIALSVAWNACIKGTWTEPLELIKANALQYEFLDYKRKYKDSGILSQELKSLETSVNSVLNQANFLGVIIKNEVISEQKEQQQNQHTVTVTQGHFDLNDGLKHLELKDGTIKQLGIEYKEYAVSNAQQILFNQKKFEYTKVEPNINHRTIYETIPISAKAIVEDSMVEDPIVANTFEQDSIQHFVDRGLVKIDSAISNILKKLNVRN